MIIVMTTSTGTVKHSCDYVNNEWYNVNSQFDACA